MTEIIKYLQMLPKIKTIVLKSVYYGEKFKKKNLEPRERCGRPPRSSVITRSKTIFKLFCYYYINLKECSIKRYGFGA